MGALTWEASREALSALDRLVGLVGSRRCTGESIAARLSKRSSVPKRTPHLLGVDLLDPDFGDGTTSNLLNCFECITEPFLLGLVVVNPYLQLAPRLCRLLDVRFPLLMHEEWLIWSVICTRVASLDRLS